VVVSRDVERANPVCATRNTVLGAVHWLSGMRDHESIFHFDFRQRSWFVARITSLGGLGNHVSYGRAAVSVAGIVASGGLASRVLASVHLVPLVSGVCAQSARMSLDHPVRCANSNVR
jgi:hypothetical protein